MGYDEDNYSRNVYEDESNLFDGKDKRNDEVSLHLMTDMTSIQKRLFLLIHPDGKGLRPKDIALELKISERAVHKMLKLMRGKYPNAFAYEIIEERQINGASDIQNVYAGYQKFAKVKDRGFTLTIEDLEEILQLPCYGCECEPTLPTVNPKTGNKFRRHHLGRFDTSKGYTYVNSKSICSKCGRLWRMV